MFLTLGMSPIVVVSTSWKFSDSIYAKTIRYLKNLYITIFWLQKQHKLAQMLHMVKAAQIIQINAELA